MLMRFKILAIGVGAVALHSGLALAAPAERVQSQKAASMLRAKPQAVSVDSTRIRKAVVDLDSIILTPVSAAMSVPEQRAVTELAQKALGLKNSLEYSRQLRNRMADVRDGLAENPNDATLQAEMAELDAKLTAASDLTSMMQLELQNAMQKQQQAFQMLSNIMKSQHDTAKAIINNIKG